MSTRRLTTWEQGTRWFFGKPYHWQFNDAGVLTLVAGEAPEAQEVSQ